MMPPVVKPICLDEYIALIDDNTVAKSGDLGMVQEIMVHVAKVCLIRKVDAGVAKPPEITIVHL